MGHGLNMNRGHGSPSSRASCVLLTLSAPDVLPEGARLVRPYVDDLDLGALLDLEPVQVGVVLVHGAPPSGQHAAS